MRTRFIIGSLLISISLMVNASPTVAQGSTQSRSQEPHSSTRVAIGEDKTVEAQCRVIPAPGEPEQMCKSGTVIFVRETTYADAKNAGIKDYIVLTNDAKLNDELKKQIAGKAHAIKHSQQNQAKSRGDTHPMGPLGTCYPNNRNITLYYLNDPYNPNTSQKIYFHLTYVVNTLCSVGSVSDQSKLDSGSGITWTATCTNGEYSQCNAWNAPLSTTYTSWRSEQASKVGNQYFHYSQNTCGLCGQPYGYWYFEN